MPFTVTLIYLASVEENVYFSEFSVVPLLVPVKTVENKEPSVDAVMTKISSSLISGIPSYIYTTNGTS